MAEWQLVVTDAIDRTLAFAETPNLKQRRILNGGCSIEGSVRLRDLAGSKLDVGRVVIKAYRDGILRFRGAPIDPVTFTPGWAKFTACDPWWWLGWRRFQLEQLVGAATAGEVIAAVLATQNARRHTHLRVSAIDQSAAPTDQVYAEDAIVTDALISTLCDVQNGVWIRIDPVDDDPDIWGEVAVLYPQPGVDRPELKFEYGEGTIGNAGDYTLQLGLPKNFIRATGASFGAAAELAFYGDIHPEAIASQLEYGLIDASIAFTDEDDETSLEAHAQDAARLTPPHTWALTPLGATKKAGKTVPGGGRISVPMLWDDFDVGDTGRGLIVDATLREQATVRISEATVDVSNDSQKETLTGLTLEVV